MKKQIKPVKLIVLNANRMNRTFLPPPAALTDYVDSILVINNNTCPDGFLLPLFANGMPTLVFQTAKAMRQNRTIGHLTLYGQTILPDMLRFQGDFTLIAYFMHPCSLISLFGIGPGELTNTCTDLGELDRVKKIRLQEQLLNETGLAGRLRLIDDFLFGLSESSEFKKHEVVYATRRLKRMKGPGTVTDIRKDLAVTERSLQRLFQQNVGISPRLYKRVCQFHGAFQQLNRSRFSRLSDIAFLHGFSDQSHFTRVFKEFTGITPSDYLNMGKDLT